MMDDIDKRLVSILQRDGRTTLSEIGKKLGMSHVAVSKRLDKLLKTEQVKLTAEVNSKYLDTKLLFMGLETESLEVAERIQKKYEKCPRLVMFAPVTGRYNVFAVMVAEDTWSLESIIGTCSMRTEPGVRKSESWFGNAPLMPEYLKLNLSPESTGDTGAPCTMDCKNCGRYITEKCVGCPCTTAYKGSFYAAPAKPTKRKHAKSKS
ncbi:MAG: Lrp/AsnC family transcriptional regulator [Candidatus Thorarchaeota archaeon]|nr:MAG: Lrp/AsnC family transcriptional regulator [Candidatus Thorarchaeota archaeon]